MVHMKKPSAFNTIESTNQPQSNTPGQRQLKKSKIVKIGPTSQIVAHNMTHHKFAQIS